MITYPSDQCALNQSLEAERPLQLRGPSGVHRATPLRLSYAQHLSTIRKRHFTYCIVAIHLYSTSCSAYQSEALHSFIQTISIAPLQVPYYSEALPIQHKYCVGVNTPKCHRQLQVKDLPKVPTWWQERDSNQRPSGYRLNQSATTSHASSARDP